MNVLDSEYSACGHDCSSTKGFSQFQNPNKVPTREFTQAVAIHGTMALHPSAADSSDIADHDS